MPNSSNKNFPHAYGAGRAIAAFTLTHPGGTSPPSSLGEPSDLSYPPGGSAMLVQPPALQDPDLATDHPYPPVSETLDLPNLTVTAKFVPSERQPYNATSIGVYATGSGLRRLPYREALGLEITDSVSPSLNAKWPSNGLYPFSLVDETKIGTTTAQVVTAVRSGAEGSFTGELAYYEVGLDWDIPPLKVQFNLEDGELPEVTSENLLTRSRVTVMEALRRTLWCTASISGNGLAEIHPEVNSDPVSGGISPLEQFTQGYETTFGDVILDDDEDSRYGWCTPYSQRLGGGGTLGNFALPNRFPWSEAAAERFYQWPGQVQAQISAVLVSKTEVIKLNPDDPDKAIGTLEAKYVPVVRIWVSMPNDLEGADCRSASPRPLPRYRLSPYSFNSAFESEVGSLLPAVTVSVFQKNSAATDGTDNPAYDFRDLWAAFGLPSESPPPVPRVRSRPDDGLLEKVRSKLGLKKPEVL